MIVGRSSDSLEVAGDQLSTQHQVMVETIVADLSTDQGMATVATRLSDDDKPIDLLVNNAGFGFDGAFLDIDAQDHVRMLRLNCEAVLRLSHAAFGSMVGRRRGGILNVSSVAGFTSGLRPSPTYSATKAFVTALSEGLALAAEGSGVQVTVVCPGFVRTAFHDRAGIDMSKVPAWLWSEADDVVDAALNGLRTGKSIVIPGMQYKAVTAFARHAPRPLLRQAAKMVGRRAR